MRIGSPQLCVGPVRFVFGGEAGCLVHYADWAYRGFFTTAGRDDALTDQVTLPVRIVTGTPALPGREPDFAAGRNWALWENGNMMRFCSGFAGGRERPRFACDLPSSLDGCDLYVNGPAEEAPLRYPLDQILTWGLLGRCNGLLMHAAAVVRDGVGYVLAGRSGAGKSTLSGFCHDQGWAILNDDRVIVHPGPLAGQWLVSGTPWHGSGFYACNRTVPLKGIYLLEQDSRNEAIAMSRRDARLALMDVVAIAWFSSSWSQAALDTLDRFCTDVPVCRLHFTRSVSAVGCLGLEVAA